MTFQTLKEAEDFYTEKFARTNDLDEEKYRVETWLAEQDIVELRNELEPTNETN